MSKERELLIRARDTLRGLKETHYDLYWDIQAALDQPEQTEQEDIRDVWQDGYEAGLRFAKREPLSKDGILELWANKPLMDLFECTRLVEKAHGIGGEE